MPSPFPGMDPYLENPTVWPDVHHELISEMRAALSPQLRPRYFVRVENRVYISDEQDPGRWAIVPDLHLVKYTGPKPERSVLPTGVESVASEPVITVTMGQDEVREARLEIIDTEDRAVVTVIEVVSPSNKIDGSRGRDSYREKRIDVMNTPSHLVEIDLLRGGRSFLPRDICSEGDYFAHVSRAEMRPKGTVWPIRLNQRLPEIQIPLKPGDADAHLDLQQVLNAAYERAAYDLAIDYRREPDPPLPPDYAAWADNVLRNAGRR